MTDVVERLRDNLGDQFTVGGCQGCYRNVMDEAADEIASLRREKAVIADLLRLHRCNSDGRQSVGECVDQGQCGCSCGLLLRSATEKGEPT